MSLEQAIQDARRVLNVDPIIARLGDGNGNVYDISVPGSYWVRKVEADARLSKPFSLPVNPLANIPVVDGTAVLLGYDQFGTFCIYSANRVGMLSSNTNPLLLNPLDTAVYGKTSQTNLATLYYQRHGNTALFPFTIVVFKAPIIINGIASLFPGAGINVASFVPASGLKCYVCVFIRTDMTLEAFASTPIDVIDLLTIEADVQECITQSSANSVIICAYELNGGDATLSPDPTKNVDMRQIVNTSSSGSSGSLTVTDGTTTVTDVTDLTFNGSDFIVTDLGSGAAQVDLVTPSVQVFPVSTTILQQQSVLLVGSSSWSYVYASAPFGYVLYQASASDGDSFQTTSFLIAAGTYTFHVLGATDNNRGKLDFYLDADVSPFITGQDWYGSLAYGVEKTDSIIIPTDGNHTITCVMNGKNGSSSGYYHALVMMWIA